MRTKTTISFVLLALFASMPRPTTAQVIPLEQIGSEWTPVELDGVQIVCLRLTVHPSYDEEQGHSMWTVDQTLVVRNQGSESQALHLGIPDAWSLDDPSVHYEPRDFWAEAYSNGAPLEEETVAIVPNPAHPAIVFRAAQMVEIFLESGETSHLRFLFALPGETTDQGERRLSFPFHLRRLWDGPVDFGVIIVRWGDRVFSFRSNLSAYALYDDRAEWFLWGFEPDTDLEVQFLPRQSVFYMLAEHTGCPMPWEVVDRISDGNMEGIRDMLSAYDADVLEFCAELPAVLLGSQAAARRSGLTEMQLEQFAPQDSGLTGPVFVLDPDFRDEDLSQPEAMYGRCLRQEVEARQ